MTQRKLVIHVNKLKEGWDVTNLYTIVSLRASASEILTEQTIGRGLGLPYGSKTGVDAVDRLAIIAHDRFQDIVDRVNDPNSIIKKAIKIRDGGNAPFTKYQTITVPSLASMLLAVSSVFEDDCLHQSGSQTHIIKNKECQQVAQITIEVAKNYKNLKSSKNLSTHEVQKRIAKDVLNIIKKEQSDVEFAIKQDLV